MRVNDSSSRKIIRFWKETRLCLANDILGPISEDDRRIFGNVRIVCKFSEHFRALSDMSAVIPQYPDKNLTPLRQKKLAGI